VSKAESCATGADRTMWGRFLAWSRRNMPTRDSMERNRWLRPVSHRVLAPELWRFTRRSVPRGVALGMFAGIMFPFAQIVLAAAMALPFRANIPTAALTTFVTNPLTTPPLWVFAYWVGRKVLHLDSTVPGAPISTHVANDSWLRWMLAEAGPATITGLVTITLIAGLLGYTLSAVGWRIWIARKWRKRAATRSKAAKVSRET